MGGTFYFMLGLYLDAVLPREFGVPKPPFFFLNWIRKKISKETNRGEGEPDNGASNSSVRNFDPSAPLLGWSFKETIGDDEDKDVKSERRKVAKGQYSGDCPLVIKGLHKRHPAASGSPSKVAVVDLWLTVDRGECFGLIGKYSSYLSSCSVSRLILLTSFFSFLLSSSLLGENGAGKTTIISMLTGVFPPTSGHAFINGYDIRTDIDKVHLNLGVCPQFNILWEDLTVEEHLLFYSRLKGIPPALEKGHVERSMQEVGLLKYSTRRAKDLSGGMKRR
jgi:ABC-type glutathione transport system ATPase component